MFVESKKNPDKSIYITGTPCCGKTTLSKVLSGILPLHTLLEINHFMESNNLFEGYDSEYETNIYDPDIVAEQVEKFLEKHQKTILVGPPLEIKAELLSLIIVLICMKPVVLRNRMLERNYSEKKINENIEAELVGEIQGTIETYYMDKVPILVLDTCTNDIKTCIDKIVQKILEITY